MPDVTMTDDTRPFPIQGENFQRGPAYKKRCTIPWWLAEIAYKYYSETYGNQQTLERLAERGGFGRIELIRFLRRDARGKMGDS